MPDSADEDACALFQPLFTCASANRSFVTAGNSHDNAEAVAALMEETREKGFQKGLNAGRQEACRMAQAQLLPDLQTLIKTLNQVATQHRQLAASAAEHAIQLALTIVERILLQAPALTKDDLGDLRTHLEQALTRSYGCRLQLHPDDLNALHALTRDHGLTWPQVPSVEIVSHETLPKYTQQLETHTSVRPALDEQVRADLAALLGDPSALP